MSRPSSRMLQLLSFLQARRDWPGALLAERLEVSPRTLRRDVERLRDLGYRITASKGPDGGYRLDAGAELPPLLFDDEQAVAIAVALQSSAASGIDVEDGAQRALATLRQVLPSHLRHRVDGIRLPDHRAPQRVLADVLEIVSAAIEERMVLRFDYGGRGAARRTEPHGLVPRGGRWYLVAWDTDRDDWRLYRLDRMAPRTPTGPRFTPRRLPSGDAATFVEARLKGSHSENRWPCTAVFDIDLPSRDVLPWVEDGHAESLTEGTTRVEIGSWSWTGALASVMRFDAPFRIIAPDELREAATRLTERLSTAAPE